MPDELRLTADVSAAAPKLSSVAPAATTTVANDGDDGGRGGEGEGGFAGVARGARVSIFAADGYS